MINKTFHFPYLVLKLNSKRYLSKHNKEMADLRTTRDELQSTIDQLKGELRRKGLEMEEVNDNNSSLQRKLNKLQPSLDSYEEVLFFLS